jgi:phosphopantothenoylcysteine synthetase/decarboxylase
MSDAMRTVQFSDCVTDSAKEIASPANPTRTHRTGARRVKQFKPRGASITNINSPANARRSAGPLTVSLLVAGLRPSTANSAAKVTISVPANSNLTANQQLALKLRKYDCTLLSSRRLFFSTSRRSLP